MRWQRFGKTIAGFGASVIIVSLLSTIALAGDKTMSKPLYELPENCDFVKDDEMTCAPRLSPEYDDVFRGILINGPKVVAWPKDDSPKSYLKGPFGETIRGPFRLYVVVLFTFPYSMSKIDFPSEILIVAVNQVTRQVYSGRRRPLAPTPTAEEEETDDLADDAIGGYFKVSLVDDVKIPFTNATYTVYATLGEYKSNVLTIQTVVK